MKQLHLIFVVMVMFGLTIIPVNACGNNSTECQAERAAKKLQNEKNKIIFKEAKISYFNQIHTIKQNDLAVRKAIKIGFEEKQPNDIIQALRDTREAQDKQSKIDKDNAQRAFIAKVKCIHNVKKTCK